MVMAMKRKMLKTMKTLIHKISLLFGLGCALWSCSDYEETEIRTILKKGVSINVMLENFGSSESRAVTATDDDNYSVVAFSGNDQIGLYTDGGNRSDDTQNGFTNLCLTFSGPSGSNTYGYSFSTTEADCDPAQVNAAFAYFPYEENIETDGIALRGTDGRCTDILVMSKSSSSQASTSGLLGSFMHAFSEIIIIRGEGFKNPRNNEIDIYLTEGYTHAKVGDKGSDVSNNFYKAMIPYMKGDVENEDAKKWTAWQGDAYKDKENKEYPDAWYVLLPTTFGANNGTGMAEVDYVEITDDYGKTHKISSISLYRSTKFLNPGDRYPLVVEMKGLEPTLRPVDIIDWNDEEIEDYLPEGISSVGDFNTWKNAYTDYLSSSNSTLIETLAKYGDRTVSSDRTITSWHFYVTHDIDFKDTEFSIGKLAAGDILDGRNNTISNIKIKENGFIGTLSGSLMNLNLQGVNVLNDSPDSPTGGLAGIIEGGIVDHCSIDAVVESAGAVGMCAGSISGGTVQNSTFMGLIIGAESCPDYLFGSSSGSPVLTNNINGVVYSSLKSDNDD